MKIIFLDHQGVMYLKTHPNPGLLDDFDKNAVALLNSILERDNSIEIVVSSDWKRWTNLEKMQDFYKQQGIIKAPISYTNVTEIYIYNKYPEQRACEIKEYLNNNMSDIVHWVAIDDIDMRPFLTNFVWISEPNIGILQKGAKEKILDFLSS